MTSIMAPVFQPAFDYRCIRRQSIAASICCLKKFGRVLWPPNEREKEGRKKEDRKKESKIMQLVSLVSLNVFFFYFISVVPFSASLVLSVD